MLQQNTDCGKLYKTNHLISETIYIAMKIESVGEEGVQHLHRLKKTILLTV